MTTGPAFFGGSGAGGGGGTETGTIAGFTTSLWGAYGLSKLSSLYTGNAIRVRRSSDSTEADIGFSGTALNTSSLATFVGTDDAFITKWYDQSGNSNDLVQATTANQPQIVDAGNYTSEILFDGSNDVLTTSNTSGTPTGLSVHLAGRGRLKGSSVEVLVCHNASLKNCIYSQRSTGFVDDYVGTLQLDGSTLYSYDDALAEDATVFGAVFDRSQAFGAETAYYVNGSAQLTVTSTGTNVTGSFSASTWSIGSDGASPSRLAARTLLLYETAQSSTTCASLSSLLTPSFPTGGLDSYTTNLWGVYSYRKHISAYAGSCIRVRRSSDNAESDIGFVSGSLDTASLLTFVGANSAFVKTWYDQSGGGHDFTQATAANQPQIVGAGVVKRGVSFDGLNDIMTSPNSGTPAAFTAFLKGNIEATSTQVVLEQTTNANTQTACAMYYGDVSRNLTLVCTQTSSSNISKSNFTTNLVGQVVAARWDRSQAAKVDQTNLFAGGAKLTRASNGDAGTTPSGNFSAASWNIGARSGGTVATTLDLTALIIYEAAVSDANIDRIARALG